MRSSLCSVDDLSSESEEDPKHDDADAMDVQPQAQSKKTHAAMFKTTQGIPLQTPGAGPSKGKGPSRRKAKN